MTPKTAHTKAGGGDEANSASKILDGLFGKGLKSAPERGVDRPLEGSRRKSNTEQAIGEKSGGVDDSGGPATIEMEPSEKTLLDFLKEAAGPLDFLKGLFGGTRVAPRYVPPRPVMPPIGGVLASICNCFFLPFSPLLSSQFTVPRRCRASLVRQRGSLPAVSATRPRAQPAPGRRCPLRLSRY